MKNSPPRRALVGRELGEEVFVDEPEGVSRDGSREGREEADELQKHRLLELLVPARQDAGEPGVDLLDRIHREVDVGTEVLPLWQADEL